MSAFSGNKGSATCILPCLTMHAAMLMLSLNNKYFIASVFAGMLWSVDVTEPFYVHFFDVLKKNT